MGAKVTWKVYNILFSCGRPLGEDFESTGRLTFLAFLALVFPAHLQRKV